MVSAVLLCGCVSGPSSRQPATTAEMDRSPTWYFFDWIANAPYAPTFEVLDTESSLGPYAAKTKTITLKDLVKMHGHACDGLVTAACALALGLKELYPDGVIDRTDTGCISNNSPCYGDAAAYVTGGRIRFGTQKIDPRLGNEFILYRFSAGRAVRVYLRPGVFPAEIVALEKAIRGGELHTGRCASVPKAPVGIRARACQPAVNRIVRRGKA